jgi:hypothetical protein
MPKAASGRERWQAEGEGLFHQSGRAEEDCIAMRRSDQLEPHGQTLLGEAAGQRDSRAAGEGDDEGKEHPVNVGGQRLASDSVGNRCSTGKGGTATVGQTRRS